MIPPEAIGRAFFAKSGRQWLGARKPDMSAKHCYSGSFEFHPGSSCGWQAVVISFPYQQSKIAISIMGKMCLIKTDDPTPQADPARARARLKNRQSAGGST
jgi:hypothetical protein